MAHSPTHDGSVVKGLADGHIVVIGHYHEQEGLSNSKQVKEEYLSHTALQGDGFNLGKQVFEEFRDNSGGVTGFYQGQVTKGEVHGGMKALTELDCQKCEAIAHHGGQAHGKKHHKACSLHFLVPQKTGND